MLAQLAVATSLMARKGVADRGVQKTPDSLKGARQPLRCPAGTAGEAGLTGDRDRVPC